MQSPEQEDPLSSATPSRPFFLPWAGTTGVITALCYLVNAKSLSTSTPLTGTVLILSAVVGICLVCLWREVMIAKSVGEGFWVILFWLFIMTPFAIPLILLVQLAGWRSSGMFI
jgi:hypothetical protein